MTLRSGKLAVGNTNPTSLGQFQLTSDSTDTTNPIALNINSIGAAGELTASSSIQTFAQIAPVINQTSTAGYTALKINAT
jgi:ATP-dependent protease ClpP protease subunit